MTVSVLFYPVKSIQQVVTSRRSSVVPTMLDDEPKIKRNSLPWMQQAVSSEKSRIYLEIYFLPMSFSLRLKMLPEAVINAQGCRSCLLRDIQSIVHRKRLDGGDAAAREGSRREGLERFQRSFLRIEAEQRDEVQEQHKEENAESLLG